MGIAAARTKLATPYRDALPAELEFELGLLDQAPTPEGFGFRELAALGYGRAPVTFQAHRQTDERMLNVTPVTIGPTEEVWAAQCAGIFTLDGRLIAYGPLERSGPKFGAIVFGPGSLEVRR